MEVGKVTVLLASVWPRGVRTSVKIQREAEILRKDDHFFFSQFSLFVSLSERKCVSGRRGGGEGGGGQ